MDEKIQKALNSIQSQIDAMKENDYERCVKYFTPKVKEVLDSMLPFIWEKAVDKFAKNPLTIEMIDPDKSKVISNSEIELILKNGKKFCKVIREGEHWLVDNPYW